MAHKTRKQKQTMGDINPLSPRTVDEKGEAPDSRIRTAYQAWNICDDLEKSDAKRSKKRIRIFKAYNRFPPSEYSTLFKEGRSWESNVGFGMMAYVIDNSLSSYFDMVTERVLAADVKTKHGKPMERAEWSELISFAFDRLLREWDGYLLNIEQDLLDMLLFGKAIQMRESLDGWQWEHVPVEDILVPDSTKIGLCNFDVIAIKRRYQLHELYNKIKDKDSAESMGWNVEAVINAMRYQRTDWHKNRTHEEYIKDISEGNITLTSSLKEHVDVYILLVKEFNGKISKRMVLQDYTASVSCTHGSNKEETEKTAINKDGFLFSKTDFCDELQDILAMFTDCAGSGMWHKIPSLAEKIFVQCRQYDFAMNAVMDAVKVNMSLMLQASTQDATDKIKELVFGPYTIIPSDIPFVQQRFALPTMEATGAIQFMMGDMFRGIGEYRVQEKATGGEAMTATQSKLDAAESAKLTGTQLKRYNGYQTQYLRSTLKRVLNCKRGEEGYDAVERFKDYLTDNNVPKEAYKWENIDSVESNMLAGAGSPSYKLMAAEKTLGLTNVVPKDEGQAKALEDALAALHGRSNVRRYMTKPKQDPTWNERIIGFENEAFTSPIVNPINLAVHSEDNHVEHTRLHIEDMATTIALVNKKMEEGNLDEDFAKTAMQKLLNAGGHVNAHMQILAKDEGKQDMLKEFQQQLSIIQGAADKLSQQFQAMMAAKAESDDGAGLESDPEIRRKIALSQLEISTKQQLAQIKIGSIANSHAQRSEIAKEKASNDIAIQRAKEFDKIKTKRHVANLNGETE